MLNKLPIYLVVGMCVAAVAAQPPSGESGNAAAEVEIDQVQATGHIDGPYLTVSVQFDARTKEASGGVLLAQGDAALIGANDYSPLRYDPNGKAYTVTWPQSGRHHVDANFVVRSTTEADGSWRQATLAVAAGRVRQIRITSNQPDLEVQLPGALRVQRRVEQGQLVVEALLGPREPLKVRWKPQVQMTDVKPVWSSQANTIVDVRAGATRIDSMFDFQVAQGSIDNLTFNVPASLSVTAVQGAFIRTWALGDPVDGMRPLRVDLSRAQDKEYHLRIQAESAIDKLPSTVAVPAIELTGGIRSSGHLVVGTNSALQLVVQDSSGLTQIDAAAFPRVQAADAQARVTPQGKAFFYSYTGSHYQLGLLVDDIVPAYEAAGRFVARVKEDDLVIDAEIELEVRDAPLRQLDVNVPAGLVVAAVDGNQVDDYRVPDASTAGLPAAVRVTFKQPVIGRTLVHLRLELGRGPLGERQTLPALGVVGAKTQRGYVVVAGETGIEIDEPNVANLRAVHTASVPLRVPQAQYAYRFRDADWTLSLMAHRKTAQARAEIFHLQSVGEALAYGSAVVNYVITGSPVDELRFRLPDSLENVEFVGRDVQRWVRQDGVWVVKLTRKVLGDYSLALTYTQRYDANRPIQIGALDCLDVQTQTGYVVVTSHLDLKLQLASDQGTTPSGLLPIALDELPGDYRLLTSSPILAAYKYVAEPHTAMLAISPYQRSDLLPVVVDIANLQTKLAIRPDGRMESVTTIRYKVKNTTGQFLALAMPADTKVWGVSSIETRADGTEQSVRLAASHDQKSGRLLVPLRRQANPNEPATIELEYGQTHKPGGWWRRSIDLLAPGCAVPIAYADWRVTVPDGWAFTATGGNMQAQLASQTRPGLAVLADQIGRLWSRAAARWSSQAVAWVMVVLAIVLTVVLAALRRAWLPEMVVFVILLCAVWIGVLAGLGRVTPPAPQVSLNYTQAVSLDSGAALHVNAALAPQWRQAVDGWDIVGVILAVIVAAATQASPLRRRRRLRLIATAAVLAAVVYWAAKLPVTWPVLKALATWVTPAVVMVWFGYRLWRRQPMPSRVVAVTLILVLVSFGGGCSSLETSAAAADRAIVERVECALTGGADNVEVKYKLRLSTDRPSHFPLLEESALLISPADPAAHVKLKAENGRHTVCIDKPGAYDVEATFLAALPPAGEDRQRRFELPMPTALTNGVTLVIPDANMLIDAPGAALVTRRVEAGQTRIEAVFTPGASAVFTWRPRERQAAQEAVRFYAQDIALAYATSGLLQVHHAVRLQIAQGQVERLTLDIPPGQTVTSVSGPNVAAWRFDPASHNAEVRLNRPAVGSYAVTLVMQSANASAPYDVRLEPLGVRDAVDQHSEIGLASEASVYVRVDQHPAAMNVQDYVREAGTLVGAVPGLAPGQINQAFRFGPQNRAVTGRVQMVPSEVRSREVARFNVEDDRLVYNSQWDIEIAKAGRFDVDLLTPEGFDIDALEAQEVSHWDESAEMGQRRIRVHFKHKLVGTVQLRLALSQAIAEIPLKLAVPRVTVVDDIKHTGYLMIASEQGIRVSTASRQGISEVNPAEMGSAGQGLLAYQFLRPDWQLELQTEVVQARVTVQGLHVAKVTDGLVRHQHTLRYRLYHAGAKTFSLSLPSEAAGVTISGPGIARREQAAPGQWRVELADKVYDRPYVMSVVYETRYNPADGNVPLAPVRCSDADLQQGYTVVFATDRVELGAGATDAALRPADARSVPDYFAAGDLAAAAMCYRSISPEYSLVVRARRHVAAEQIDAEVLKTELASVVTAGGQMIQRVVLLMRAGNRRHLQAVLPAGASIWSLTVDGQAVQPSLRAGTGGRGALLIPLPQQTSDDVRVDMVYVTQVQESLGWAGRHTLAGPQFDLPLKNITWQVYMPQGFSYHDFGGTLAVDARLNQTGGILQYDLQTYQRRILEVNRSNELVAQQQQTMARDLAQKGDQAAARQALTKGYNFSIGNTALNEDIRVDLDNLLRQQARVGLINARSRLRQQAGGAADGPGENAVPLAGQVFSPQQAERIESSLGQADSENLEQITRRIIQTQAAAEAPVSQLQVTIPTCGQMLQFRSPLQVEPEAEMSLSFTARRARLARIDPSLWYGLVFFGLLVLGAAAMEPARRLGTRITAALTPVVEERRDPPTGQVSAEELL